MRTPDTVCRNCGHHLSAASDKEQTDQRPSAGDFTVCIYCSHLMVFNPDLTVRNPNSEEIHEAAGNRDILEVMALVKAYREYRQNESSKNP